MLDYFEDKIRFIEHSNFKNALVKEIFCDGSHYHKFYMREQFRQSEIDFDKAVERFNKFSNNHIVAHKVWKDIGALYVKSEIANFKYRLNEPKLINKFDSIQEYLEYFADKYIELNNTIYPSQLYDIFYSNLSVEEDLSWTIVDFDQMFEDSYMNVDHLIDRMISSMVACLNHYVDENTYDEFHAKGFLTNYFVSNRDKFKNVQ